MIPQHVLDVLKTLSPAQKQKFQELCMWASQSGLQGSVLPVNYDQLLDMVKQMGPNPVVPVAPPPVIDHEMLDRIKRLKGIE